MNRMRLTFFSDRLESVGFLNIVISVVMILVAAPFDGYSIYAIPVFILCFIISVVIIKRFFKDEFSNNVSISKELFKLYIKKLVIVYMVILIVFLIIITVGIIRKYDLNTSSESDNLVIEAIKYQLYAIRQIAGV